MTLHPICSVMSFPSSGTKQVEEKALTNTVNPDRIYKKNPYISFEGKSFCFTGKFDRHERVHLERYAKRQGASFTPNVSKETDYLIIGSKGLRCCSFSCCSRVFSKAMELKQRGAKLQFIKESDFLVFVEAE